VRCTFVIAKPESPHDFKGTEALGDADLLVVSVRRRAPTIEQMRLIRKYIESGKPVIGIRTASHAFDARGKAPAGHHEWRSFDSDILGGHYTGHHANEVKPKVTIARDAEGHAVLAGVSVPFFGQGSLYKTSPLAASARALLVGEIPGQRAEPMAWVNQAGPSRVFYTSLGHPGDFDNTAFRRLLRNAVFWTMDRTPSVDSISTSGAARPAFGSAGAADH
jgi:type 1 glutamine amidotransferase